MDRRQKIMSFIVLALVVFTVGSFAAGDSAYSMDNDPLVSLSYVQNLKQEIVNDLYKKVDANSFADYMRSTGFVFERMTKGQQLVATGSCEMILRGGEGTVVITDKANLVNKVGFSDLTAAREVLNGESVIKNHLMLASAGDGRLITVTSDVAYFMVRGDYTIVG